MSEKKTKLKKKMIKKLTVKKILMKRMIKKLTIKKKLKIIIKKNDNMLKNIIYSNLSLIKVLDGIIYN